jgi:hypothetical protein
LRASPNNHGFGAWNTKPPPAAGLKIIASTVSRLLLLMTHS